MPDIPPIAEIAEKFERVTPGRVPDYTAGVQHPRRDWGDATVAAAGVYTEAMTAALAAGRFALGVTKAGTRKWQEKTISKGPTRWAQGVRMAGVDFARGFQPYRDEIERIVLPPRGPRGDARNLERVRIIAEALHALKLRIG